MFNDYSPNPLHFFLPALFFIAGSVTMAHMLGLGLAFWFLGLLASLWVFIAGLWHARAEFNTSLADIAREIRMMNPEQWQALGIRFPELRIHYHGEPTVTVEDSGVRIEYFQRFIEDSDDTQFAPERLYGDGTSARNEWFLCRDWLIKHNYLIPNSAVGNHSWLWRTGRRQELIQKYLIDPRHIPNLDDNPEPA